MIELPTAIRVYEGLEIGLLRNRRRGLLLVSGHSFGGRSTFLIRDVQAGQLVLEGVRVRLGRVCDHALDLAGGAGREGALLFTTL